MGDAEVEERTDERIPLSPGKFLDATSHDEDRATYAALPDDLKTSYGAVRIQLPLLPGPARRVTRHPSEAMALLGTGSSYFDPEPGSKAVVLLVPAAFILAVTRWVLPWLKRLLPDWNLSSIPWPDWDLPDLPGWMEPVLKFLVPVTGAAGRGARKARCDVSRWTGRCSARCR